MSRLAYCAITNPTSAQARGGPETSTPPAERAARTRSTPWMPPSRVECDFSAPAA